MLSAAVTETFDYVIVGGGSAGAVLAARLAERSDVSVCLIEAGPRDRNPLLHIPAGYVKVVADPRYTWKYETAAGPGIGGRTMPLIQGRVLGGSGAINGMIYTRGQAEDFDAWAAAGNRGWGYEDILPYFRKSEGRVGAGEATFRGRDGPMPVVDSGWQNALVDAFIGAAGQQGIPPNPDYNGASQAGAARYQYTIRNGLRYSAARAYLRPAEKRRNLQVITDVLATGVLLEGTRAIGVTIQRGRGSTREAFHARRDVVLSCGAVNTPKLLQLSGIGPANVLRDLGIEVRHANDGIGTNLQDHYAPRLTYRVRNAETINALARGPRLLGQAIRWALGRPSILGIGVVLGTAFWKSQPGLIRPDVVVNFTPGTFMADFHGDLEKAPGVTCGAWQLRPESRGYVRLRSASPWENPIIQPNFLAEELDCRTTVAAIRLARQIMGAPALAQMCEAEIIPGADMRSEDELLDYARGNGICGHHVSGTCRMGPSDDLLAVVDDQLRVRGISGLRVVDASIMPTLVSGNTNAATMMIAEKAADLMRGPA